MSVYRPKSMKSRTHEHRVIVSMAHRERSKASRVHRQRSMAVNDLKALFTVIFGFALVEAVKSVFRIQEANIFVLIDNVPQAISLAFTLLPFFQGNTRFLDDRYLNESDIQTFDGIVEYFMFLLQGVIFYALALLIPNPLYFYNVFIVLFGVDVIWLVHSFYSTRKEIRKLKTWGFLNTGMVFVLLLLVDGNIMNNNEWKWITITFTLITRTMLDYGLTWEFYWPNVTKKKSKDKEAEANNKSMQIPVSKQL